VRIETFGHDDFRLQDGEHFGSHRVPAQMVVGLHRSYWMTDDFCNRDFDPAVVPCIAATEVFKRPVLEKARVFDPFERAGLTPLGKIRLTPADEIKMTPVEASAGEFFCSFKL